MTTRIVLGGLLALAGVVVGARPAAACGGCFGPTGQPTVVTAHRMAISLSAERTILWDQFEYAGSPDDFVWVLPVAGDQDVRVELAENAFFPGAPAGHHPPAPGPLHLAVERRGRLRLRLRIGGERAGRGGPELRSGRPLLRGHGRPLRDGHDRLRGSRGAPPLASGAWLQRARRHAADHRALRRARDELRRPAPLAGRERDAHAAGPRGHPRPQRELPAAHGRRRGRRSRRARALRHRRGSLRGGGLPERRGRPRRHRLRLGAPPPTTTTSWPRPWWPAGTGAPGSPSTPSRSTTTGRSATSA
ncbi:MAG: hypothetical protein M5U28_01405 [Sandaracinaceae bacterium]|nr:hypothetical protein [Sandaracinaceae bacterium]